MKIAYRLLLPFLLTSSGFVWKLNPRHHFVDLPARKPAISEIQLHYSAIIYGRPSRLYAEGFQKGATATVQRIVEREEAKQKKSEQEKASGTFSFTSRINIAHFYLFDCYI